MFLSFHVKAFLKVLLVTLLCVTQMMYKPASSSNGLSGWWSGESEEEMEQQEVVLKTQLPMQLPDCPVCWDSFDDGPRMPRLLHCGHTICQVCHFSGVLFLRILRGVLCSYWVSNMIIF